MKFGYIRVSSSDQNTARQLPDTQVDKTFEEKVSGATRDREQLNLMLQTLRAGDEVFVHELSRLGRSLIDLKQIVQEITDKGCKIHFVKENMTFSRDAVNHVADLTLNLLASFAEFERSILKQRQAEGIAAAKQAGKYKKPVGRAKKLTDKQIKEVREMLAANKTKTFVAKAFNVSRPTLDKTLAEDRL